MLFKTLAHSHIIPSSVRSNSDNSRLAPRRDLHGNSDQNKHHHGHTGMGSHHGYHHHSSGIVVVNTVQIVLVDKVVALNNSALALQAIRRMLIVNSTVSSSIEALNSTKNAPIDC